MRGYLVVFNLKFSWITLEWDVQKLKKMFVCTVLLIFDYYKLAAIFRNLTHNFRLRAPIYLQKNDFWRRLRLATNNAQKGTDLHYAIWKGRIGMFIHRWAHLNFIRCLLTLDACRRWQVFDNASFDHQGIVYEKVSPSWMLQSKMRFRTNKSAAKNAKRVGNWTCADTCLSSPWQT